MSKLELALQGFERAGRRLARNPVALARPTVEVEQACAEATRQRCPWSKYQEIGGVQHRPRLIASGAMRIRAPCIPQEHARKPTGAGTGGARPAWPRGPAARRGPARPGAAAPPTRACAAR